MNLSHSKVIKDLLITCIAVAWGVFLLLIILGGCAVVGSHQSDAGDKITALEDAGCGDNATLLKWSRMSRNGASDAEWIYFNTRLDDRLHECAGRKVPGQRK